MTTISSLLGAINFIVTILNMRSIGLHMVNMPLFTWAVFFTAILLLLSLPVLTAAVTLLLMDRNFNTGFYEVGAGGDPVLYEHLFWNKYIYMISLLLVIPAIAGFIYVYIYLFTFLVFILKIIPFINNKDLISKIKNENYIFKDKNLNKFINKNKKFNLNLFYEEYEKLYPNNKKPNKEFLEWLIGFTEGDGSFIATKNKELFFVITQSESDLNILNLIKNNLNIGNINIQSNKNKTYRYVIRKKSDIYLICLLFNGNMVMPTKQQRFIQFLIILNEYIIKYKNNKYNIIEPLNYCILPSLKDSWLAGFTDAEGCFTCSILSNSNNAYRIRYILTQKWDINKEILEYILNIWSKSIYQKNDNIKLIGSIVPHSIENYWEIRINGLKNCLIILDYFDNYPLLSKKKYSYILFKEILIKLTNKEHLNPITRKDLIILAKKVNK